jgi:DNA-directed RNA polymerase subunit L
MPSLSDLELDLLPALTVEFAGELSDVDMFRLDEPPKAPSRANVSSIVKLRDTHHALARALAMGMTQTEAAEVAGYSVARVSLLGDDPAFQELIAHYRGIKDEAFRDFHKQAASLSLDMLEELRDRFETQTDKMGNEFLIDTVTKLADRTGHGPRTTQVNVNLDLAGRIEAARKRAGLVPVEPAASSRLTGGEERLVLDLLPSTLSEAP